jgi:elongation factor Ts
MDNKKIIELVKEIREATGFGVMEIKAAVEEANGDKVKAMEILKKKGAEIAAKKAERETRQGRVATYTHSTGKIGVMVELLCETDFVAKNDEFMNVAREIALQIAAMNPKDSEELLAQDYIKDPSRKIDDLIKELIAKFGENIKLGRFERFEI